MSREEVKEYIQDKAESYTENFKYYEELEQQIKEAKEAQNIIYQTKTKTVTKLYDILCSLGYTYICFSNRFLNRNERKTVINNIKYFNKCLKGKKKTIEAVDEVEICIDDRLRQIKKDFKVLYKVKLSLLEYLDKLKINNRKSKNLIQRGLQTL